MVRFLFAVLIGAIPFAAVADQTYTLNPGDVLAISVLKEEGLQGEVLVLPDGTRVENLELNDLLTLLRGLR